MYRKMPGSWRTSRLRKKRRKWMAERRRKIAAIDAETQRQFLRVHDVILAHRLSLMAQHMALPANAFNGTRLDYSTARADAAMYANMWGVPRASFINDALGDVVDAARLATKNYKDFRDAIEQLRATGEVFWDADGNLIDSGRVAGSDQQH